MKKALLIIYVILIFICFAFGYHMARKEKQEFKIPASHKIEVEIKTDLDLLTEIKEAQKLLENEDAGYYMKDIAMYSKVKKGKGRKARTIVRRWKVQKLEDFNVLLAVVNTKRPERKIELIKLERKGNKAPSGFSVNFSRRNGVGTPYKVTYPSGYILLGLKQVVQIGRGFKEVVNTPYTKEIDTPELRKAGMEYLRTKIGVAEYDLRKRGVKSLAYDGLVADAVPTNVSLILSIIEHVDPARFNKNEPVEQLINEVLVTIAANQETAYQYAVSKAGARSLFQFIPRTYKAIDVRYPKAGLSMDFVRGMNSHLNGAKASLLLFDADLSFLNKDQRMHLKKYPEEMGKYLAAAYNGGAGRAASAIKAHGDNWENKVLPETVVYLKKFGAVWEALDI